MCDSRLALIDRHSLRLGGQHGEEGKVQDGRQENGKEECEEEEREAQVSDGRTRRSRRRPGQTLVATPTTSKSGRRRTATKRGAGSIRRKGVGENEVRLFGGDLLPNGSVLEHLAGALNLTPTPSENSLRVRRPSEVSCCLFELRAALESLVACAPILRPLHSLLGLAGGLSFLRLRNGEGFRIVSAASKIRQDGPAAS